MLVIGVSLVSFWKSLSPSEFQAWFASLLSPARSGHDPSGNRVCRGNGGGGCCLLARAGPSLAAHRGFLGDGGDGDLPASVCTYQRSVRGRRAVRF
jgi:hypothetical protein